jgi:hypothetical protein
VEDRVREEAVDEAAWEDREQDPEVIVSVPSADIVLLTRGEPPVTRWYVPNVEKR